MITIAVSGNLLVMIAVARRAEMRTGEQKNPQNVLKISLAENKFFAKQIH